MQRKKYLPVWTDGLTYEETHLTYWIANNEERKNPDYSFLPIRLEGDSFCGRKTFDNIIHLIGNYFEERKCRMVSKVVPLSYYVAEKAFDLAAEDFLEQYPYASHVTFHGMNDNGVYNSEFEMDYTSRLTIFQRILDEKIDEVCIVDEIFEFEKEEQDRHDSWPDYRVNALIDINEDNIYYNFPQILSAYGYPYVPKKKVRVKKEDVYRYFVSIPENIFVLGNQYIKYKENAREFSELFRAAENKDLDVIAHHVQNGVDINMIDSDGRTIFAKYMSWDYEKEKCGVEDLKTLMLLGASPAIYGAGFDEVPLATACLDEHIDAITLLLENGVNPHLYPCIDESFESFSETLLERTQRWAEGDPNIDGVPSETQSAILKLLREYA